MGWPVAAAALAPAAVLLWVATSPQLYYMLAEWGLSLLAFVAMVLGHGAWLVAKRVAARRYGRAATTVWNDHRRWAVVWAVTVVAAVLVVLKVPMRVSFLLHRPALERLVAEVRADAPTVQHFPGRHVGIYRLSDYPVDANGRALMFHFGATGEGGFAFSPDGEAELKYNSGDHGHLWGAWYWFSED